MDLWFKPAAGVSKFLSAGADLDQDEEEAEEEGAVTFLTIEGNGDVKKRYFTRLKNVNVASGRSGQFVFKTHVIDVAW